MRLYQSIFLFGYFVVIQPEAFSQIVKFPEYSIEMGTAQSFGRETPFWIFSNQYGLLTTNKYNGWIKTGFHSNLSETKNIDYAYCLDLVNRYSDKNDLYLNQGYLRLKLYFLNIQAGSIEEKFGDQDSSLSSGGLLWSGNARPMAEVSVMVPNYTKVPFTFGMFEFKGGITHGWFDNNQFIKHAWLHHKYAYIQFGGKWPVHIHYGFHHYAEWGGQTAAGKQLPDNFSDFIKVFFAKGGVRGSPTADSLNALGNHLGSRNFGLDIDFPKVKVGLYWQTIFEDGSGLAYRNIKDGLWGFYLHTRDKNNLINGFVYEFINTTNQSGHYDSYWILNGKQYFKPIAGGIHHEAGGNDDYFNNGVYTFGWTYRNMTIGSPLITSPAILAGNPQAILKGTQSDFIRNNKITGHHIGVEGMYKYISYKVFYTYYLNFGTNFFPISPKKTQQSILFQSNLSNRLPWGLELGIKMGIDIGTMYGNNFGIQVSFIKRGPF